MQWEQKVKVQSLLLELKKHNDFSEGYSEEEQDREQKNQGKEEREDPEEEEEQEGEQDLSGGLDLTWVSQ